MSGPPPSSGPSAKARACAVCGKPQDDRFKPFCSKRCTDVDLGRWLKGSYAIPVQGDPDGGEKPDSDEIG